MVGYFDELNKVFDKSIYLNDEQTFLFQNDIIFNREKVFI